MKLLPQKLASRGSRRWLLLIKAIVGAALIGLLLSQFDLAAFTALVRQLDTSFALLAAILLILQFPLSAWKWQQSLRAHALDFGFGYLLRVLCIAFFFNNFLPTSIGGDAYRAYRTAAPGNSPVQPVSAVILERLLGILALMAIGVFCMIFLLHNGALVHARLMQLVLAGAGAVAVVLLAASYTKPAKMLRKRLAENPRLHNLVLNMRTLAGHPRELGLTVALSFAFQFLAVATVGVLYMSLGVDASFIQSGFVSLASGIAAVLPISINGIGVMEGSFTVAALETGLPYEQSVFVALSLRFFMLVASVACGLLYFLDPGRPARLEEAAK
jgi:glycosyltransferase 2 family protein